MKTKKTIISLVSTSLLLSSCATIMHGTTQSIGISTNPHNAEVWLDNRLAGHSPIILEMSRNENHIVRIELEGYQPYELTFTRKISGWCAGNLVFGGVIGLVIDALSGGIYTLTPEQVQVEMSKGNVAFSKQSNDTFIAVIMKADPSWQKIGVMVRKA